MENFDLRKYLAEGRLLKEDMTSKAVSVLKSYKGEVKGLEDYIKYLMNTSDDISSSIQAIADDMDRDNDAEDSLRRDLEKLSLAEGKLLKEDITKLRGQELLDFFSFTKYMNVDVEELETEFIEAINGGWFTDPSNFEEEKKDFTYESGDRFLDTNEDKMSEYLGFEIDTSRMIDDYTMGDPMGVEFVHSDEDFEGWMDEVGSFWD